MTMPSQEAQRIRETAMEAERYWHTTLQALVATWGELAEAFGTSDNVSALTAAAWLQRCADQLDALITERAK